MLYGVSPAFGRTVAKVETDMEDLCSEENRLVMPISHNGDANGKPALIQNDGKVFAQSGAVGIDVMPKLIIWHCWQEVITCKKAWIALENMLAKNLLGRMHAA